jgi:hypothetical protein
MRQRALGIPDSPEVFEADTLKSAAKDARPALIRTLTHQSGPSIEWLIDSFDLDLSVVSRLAAHTHPRTHRGKDGNSRFVASVGSYHGIHLRFYSAYDLPSVVMDSVWMFRLCHGVFPLASALTRFTPRLCSALFAQLPGHDDHVPLD